MFAHDMILYIGEPKHSIKRLLELLREFGRVAGYKIIEHKIDCASIYK